MTPTATRTIHAPRARVWSLLSDIEGWPAWAPGTARNAIESVRVVSKDSGSVTCDQTDRFSWARSSHSSTINFAPKERITETSEGSTGSATVTLKDSASSTIVTVEDSRRPAGFLVGLYLLFAGKDRIVSSFWNEVLAQLASLAEGTCSPEAPMYCPSKLLDLYFRLPSLPMGELVNKGDRRIDIDTLTIYDDHRWKGFYPPDSPFPAWVFQNGFNKTFLMSDGALAGVTSTFDDNIKGRNRLSLVDPSVPTKGVLLEYVDPQYSMFYDELKIISKDLVVGKVFLGKFPSGANFLNFSMARKYGFDFMSPEDHRELFEKYGKAPDVSKISGEWEGRMVSNASLTPPLFRFWYSVDSSGKVSCKWNFMNILKGDSKIELTKDDLMMFDFTNFHDEIRMVRDDAMVGRYQPKAQRILDVLGDRDLGLLHFEKSPAGDRPAIYYYIKKVQEAGPPP